MDYCDIEWFAWETNRDHSVVFEIASKYCILPRRGIASPVAIRRGEGAQRKRCREARTAGAAGQGRGRRVFSEERRVYNS